MLLKLRKTSALSKYRLRDNYLRFYIKYIASKLIQINRNQYVDTALSSLLGWDTIMGLQLENLVLNNRELIQKILGLDPNYIVQDNLFSNDSLQKLKSAKLITLSRLSIIHCMFSKLNFLVMKLAFKSLHK